MKSAAIIRQIFNSEPGPCRDTVIAGTAAGLLLVGAVGSLADGVAKAIETIDSGAAKDKLAALAQS